MLRRAGRADENGRRPWRRDGRHFRWRGRDGGRPGKSFGDEGELRSPQSEQSVPHSHKMPATLPSPPSSQAPLCKRAVVVQLPPSAAKSSQEAGVERGHAFIGARLIAEHTSPGAEVSAGQGPVCIISLTLEYSGMAPVRQLMQSLSRTGLSLPPHKMQLCGKSNQRCTPIPQ